jgi:hypothetical protein
MVTALQHSKNMLLKPNYRIKKAHKQLVNAQCIADAWYKPQQHYMYLLKANVSMFH